MTTENNDHDIQTILPSVTRIVPSNPAAPTLDANNVDETVVNNWIGLLATYRRLLDRRPVRRIDFVSIEDYARQNGLWLLLDSIPIDLVAMEIKVRQAADLPVRKSEYLARFPHLTQALNQFSFESSDNQLVPDDRTKDTTSTILKGKVQGEDSLSSKSLSSKSLSVGSSFGQYQIDREIGQGGMGAVFQATHTKLNKRVALKILPPSFTEDRDRVLRFEREMRSLGRVDHPNIVRALDAGEIDGVQYLAMEYVEGVDLQQMVQKLGPSKPELICKLIAQTAAGLHVAHSVGLVHRDVKPSNILMTRDGTVKIVDLGLARIQSSDPQSDASDALTMQRQMMGTPDYMAPEQWANAADADSRADLYSLGCTLYFLLSGQPPFGGREMNSLSRKMKAHLSSPPPRLQSLGIALPDGLESLYEKLMAKEPSNRPKNAIEVVQALNRIFPGSDGQTNISRLVDLQKLHELSIEKEKSSTDTKAVPTPWLMAACGVGVIALVSLMLAFNVRPAIAPPFHRNVSGPLLTASIDVEIIQKRSETDLQRRGIIGQQIDSAKLGDLAKLSIRFPQSRYCYVVALNPTDDPDWRVQLIYPASDDIEPESAASLTLPSKGTSYIPLTDGSGQQVYVVIESSRALLPFRDWQAKHDWVATWKKCQRSGVWQCVDDNLSLRPLPEQSRAAIVDIAPPELSSVLETLHASLVKDQQHMTAIAFPIQAPYTR